MSNNKMPKGFPLEPIDSQGNQITEGDTVKILVIPDSLTRDLSEEDVKIIKSCEGASMVVDEIDKYGYAWVQKVSIETDSDYQSNSFSMEPKYLLKKNGK